MPQPSPDLILVAVATGCLWLGLLLSQATAMRSAVARALLIGAAACAAGSVTVAATTYQEAMGSGAELLTFTAGAALLWHATRSSRPSPRRESLVLGAAASFLLAWAASIGWYTPAAWQSGPQAWRTVAHLPLALACGSFIQSSCAGIARWGSTSGVQPPTGPSTTQPGRRRNGALGLALLTAALLLTMVGTLFITGTWWTWSAAEAWTLLLLLWQAIAWLGSGFLQRRGRGAALVDAISLLVTIATLHAVVG